MVVCGVVASFIPKGTQTPLGLTRRTAKKYVSRANDHHADAATGMGGSEIYRRKRPATVRSTTPSPVQAAESRRNAPATSLIQYIAIYIKLPNPERSSDKIRMNCIFIFHLGTFPKIRLPHEEPTRSRRAFLWRPPKKLVPPGEASPRKASVISRKRRCGHLR